MTAIQRLAIKLFRIAIPKAPLVPRDTKDFTLSDWRKNAALVSSAMSLSTNKTFKLQVEILRNESPSHIVLQLGVSPNDRIVMQARIEGYELALNNLEAFSKPLKLADRLQSTFEAPETK